MSKPPKTPQASNLEDLLVRCEQNDQGSRCFAVFLSPPALEFLDLVVAEVRTGRRLLYTKIAEILNEEFNVAVVPQTVSRHMKGLCQCEKRQRVKS